MEAKTQTDKHSNNAGDCPQEGKKVRTMTVKIETDNDAFQDGNKGRELARILEIIAERVRNGETFGRIRDVNGNTVGSFSL